MKVCMLMTTDYIHDRRVRKEARSLLEAGHRVTIIATRGLEEKGLYGSNQEAALKSAGALEPVKLIQIPISPRSRHRVRALRLLLDLFRSFLPAFLSFLHAALREKAQLYHCHDLDTLPMGYIASRLRGARLIYDCHDIYSELRTPGTFISAFRPMWRLIEMLLIPKADGVITVSKSYAQFLRRWCKRAPLVVLNNCPYLHPWQKSSRIREQFRLPPSDRIVLFFGALRPGDRGVELAIDSFRYLPAGVRLVLLGKVSEEQAALLEKRINSLPGQQRVHLSGFIAMEEVPEYLMSADISLVPFPNLSVAYDTLPNKLFESMMAGLPVVANGLPSMRGIIQETGCGLVVEEFSPRAFATAIGRLVQDDSLRERLGLQGRRATEEKYHWEKEAEKLTALYERLSGDGEGRG